MATKTMPKEEGFENGLKVLREGYRYIPNRMRMYQSDIFATRLLGQKAVCISGEAAARLFYDESKIKRNGAAPKFIMANLLGKDSVFILDDVKHRNRKQNFMNLMTEERIRDWSLIVKKHLLKGALQWLEEPSIVFYEESKKALTRAVCEWAGIPLLEEDVEKRTHQLSDVFEILRRPSQFARGFSSQKGGRKWAEKLIRKVRAEDFRPAEDTALYQIAFHKNLDGTLMDTAVAATDLLSILRPSVAVAIFMNFVALSLHQFPEIRAKLQTEDVEGAYYEAFVQEVRRYYPFVPFNAGYARSDFTWNGYAIEEETMIVFDFYGTCHDERIWENPEAFNPDRFLDGKGNPSDHVQFRHVAHGGGDYLTGHRCPGEWNTVEAMKVTAEVLTKHIAYDVPPQDVSYSLTSLPMLPESGMVFEKVR